ncbi:MAG: NHL repeat-containing protein [Ignavibacteriales bacterium]|nr:NHL repeat-containing protein [Ignavibacteriales bacterium]
MNKAFVPVILLAVAQETLSQTLDTTIDSRRGLPVPAGTLVREEYALGVFVRATRFTVSPQGWIYVVDEGQNVIQLFKERTSDPWSVGGYGWSATTFDKPTGIDGDGLNVYIADNGNHRIQRFDKNLNFLSSLATRDTSYAPSRFGYPGGVAISKLGELFVLDVENLRIVRFSSDGRYLQTFGSFDAEKGRLVRPEKIVISSDDRIYVAEPNRIIEFDYFGNFVRTLGDGVLNGARSCEAAGDAVLAVTRDSLFWFSREGHLKNRISWRSIITSEPMLDVQDVALIQDFLYVLDAKRLFVFRLVH